MTPIKNIFQGHKSHWSYNTGEIYCYIMYAIQSIHQNDFEKPILQFRILKELLLEVIVITALAIWPALTTFTACSAAFSLFPVSLLLNPRLFCLLLLEAYFPLFPSASFRLPHSPSLPCSINASYKCPYHCALLIHIYLLHIHIS